MVVVTAPFIANSQSYQDVPGSLIDQVAQLNMYRSWKSVGFQIQEVGKAGSLRWQLWGSMDGQNWFQIGGCALANPTQGEEGGFLDINPGGLELVQLTDQDQPILMSYRYFKIVVLSPSTNSNQYGQAMVTIFAR